MHAHFEHRQTATGHDGKAGPKHVKLQIDLSVAMKYTAAFAIVVVTAILFIAAGYSSKSRREAAAELLMVSHLEETLLEGSANKVDDMIQQNPALASYRDVLVKWGEKVFTRETIAVRLAALFSELFTESELREMAAFYKSPTGQKVTALTPEVMRRCALIGAEVAQEHKLELEQMIRERSAELEKATPKP